MGLFLSALCTHLYRNTLYIISSNLSQNLSLIKVAMNIVAYRLIFLPPLDVLLSLTRSYLANIDFIFYATCNLGLVAFFIFVTSIIMKLFPHQCQVKVRTTNIRRWDEIWQITIILRAVSRAWISLIPHFGNYRKSIISPSLIFLTGKHRSNGILMKEQHWSKSYRRDAARILNSPFLMLPTAWRFYAVLPRLILKLACWISFPGRRYTYLRIESGCASKARVRKQPCREPLVATGHAIVTYNISRAP